MSVSPAGQRHANTRAVITGGGQGVGFAIAEALVAEGCRSLALVGRDEGKLEKAAEGLPKSAAKVMAISADISDVRECKRVIAEAIAGLGGVNAFANAAATTARGWLHDTSEETYDMIMDTNLKGPFFLMQAVVQHALEKKTPASLLNILSMSGHGGQPFLAPYSTSKGALAILTRNIANAYRRERIRCNAIMPGWMDTPGEDMVQKKWHDAPDDWLAKAEASVPMGQLVKTDQLALLASYILSPDSGVMTGALVDYDQNIVGAYD